MLDGLLVAAIVVGALACPLMMWLGRRGIGPGCAFGTRAAEEDEETLASLRARQGELAVRIAELETDEGPPRTAVPTHD